MRKRARAFKEEEEEEPVIQEPGSEEGELRAITFLDQAGPVAVGLSSGYDSGAVHLALGRCVWRWGGAFGAGAIRLALEGRTYK